MSDEALVAQSMMVNTAGEAERESRSRRYNALEALGMMVFVLVMLWPVTYYLTVLKGVEGAQTVANILLGIGACYLLFVSPFVHRDTLDSWGLGNPFTLWRMLKEGGAVQRGVIIGVLVILYAVLNCANYMNWPDVAKFVGLKGTSAMAWKETFVPGVILFGLGLSSFIILFMIRYDNFLSAFATAMKVSLPLLVVAFLAAIAHRGMDVFKTMSLSTWALGVFGYVFWGAIQQLLFCSYFGTRFRKAFGPSTGPENIVASGDRLTVMGKFAVFFAAGALCLGLVGLYIAYGNEGVSLPIILGVGIFFLPVGALFGYFFCLDKKRLLVATFSASCFGLIHIDSYGLVVVTWMLGIILIYVFMESKNRNLFALGFIHGLLGSTFGELFSSGESGALEIDYSVGPMGIETPGYGALIIPMLCIAIYIGVMVWAWKTMRSAPENA